MGQLEPTAINPPKATQPARSWGKFPGLSTLAKVLMVNQKGAVALSSVRSAEPLTEVTSCTREETATVNLPLISSQSDARADASQTQGLPQISSYTHLPFSEIPTQLSSQETCEESWAKRGQVLRLPRATQLP